ncbi:hypothetical protein BKA70DRAFT_1305858 [Coprinopsis sp. MPI-PUGE-AT-0042]|nr:hypothetical protein BKA70DRAFT_1305858 [Coprinopsis sp. MPI-PUGE-AT-0042]
MPSWRTAHPGHAINNGTLTGRPRSGVRTRKYPHRCTCYLSRRVNPFKSYNTQEPQAAFLHQNEHELPIPRWKRLSLHPPDQPFLSIDSVWPPSRRFYLHHVALTRVHTLPRVDLQQHNRTTLSLSQHPSSLKAQVRELRSGVKLCLGSVVKVRLKTHTFFCLPELQSYGTCDSGLGASTVPLAQTVHPRYAYLSLRLPSIPTVC